MYKPKVPWPTTADPELWKKWHTEMSLWWQETWYSTSIRDIDFAIAERNRLLEEAANPKPRQISFSCAGTFIGSPDHKRIRATNVAVQFERQRAERLELLYDTSRYPSGLRVIVTAMTMTLVGVLIIMLLA